MIGILLTNFHGILHPASLKIVLAIAYPVGFIFVILGRSELFTEHTVLAVLPVINGSASIMSLSKLWGIIIGGNLVGSYIFAGIITNLGPSMNIISHEAFYEVAHELTNHSWSIIFSSSILAGWLMGLLSWLVTSSRDTISRIFIVILITFVIGLGGLHHSVVGSIEVFSGLLISSEINWNDYIKFQTAATSGNVVGGVVFVALLKYGLTNWK